MKNDSRCPVVSTIVGTDEEVSTMAYLDGTVKSIVYNKDGPVRMTWSRDNHWRMLSELYYKDGKIHKVEHKLLDSDAKITIDFKWLDAYEVKVIESIVLNDFKFIIADRIHHCSCVQLVLKTFQQVAKQVNALTAPGEVYEP